MKKSGHVVYMLHDSTGAIKVGYSKNVRARIGNVYGKGPPVLLKVFELPSIAAARRVEKAAHFLLRDCFADGYMINEWFTASQDKVLRCILLAVKAEKRVSRRRDGSMGKPIKWWHLVATMFPGHRISAIAHGKLMPRTRIKYDYI